MAVHNREEFLNHVAKRLGRPLKLEGVKRPKWSVTPQIDKYKDLSKEELIDMLIKQAQEIGTNVFRTNKDGLVNVLKDAIKEYDGVKIITAKDKRNEDYGLIAFFDSEKDLQVHVWDYELGKDNMRIAEQADIGIIFSDITLAETATVTIFNNKDHGNSIVIMPKDYIAIIPTSTIVPRFTQAASQIHNRIANGEQIETCVSFITGPSNSADIEMVRVVGVHGPVRATYILVDDE